MLEEIDNSSFGKAATQLVRGWLNAISACSEGSLTDEEQSWLKRDDVMGASRKNDPRLLA